MCKGGTFTYSNSSIKSRVTYSNNTKIMGGEWVIWGRELFFHLFLTKSFNSILLNLIMKTSQNVLLRDLFGGVTYKIFYFVNVINASPCENSSARLIWIIRVFEKKYIFRPQNMKKNGCKYFTIYKESDFIISKI